MSFLDSFRKPTKQVTEYVVAVSLMQGIVDCALWHLGDGNTVEVLDVARQLFSGGWKEVIDAADTAISKLEENLGKDDQLNSVVFGLMPEVLENDAVKPDELANLKKFTKELALKPLGFVEIPIALSHFLGKQKGTPQTHILIGVEQRTITTSIFTVGKDSGSTTVNRSDNIALDVENSLRYFPDTESLPTQILLYGAKGQCEKIKQTLLQYPWQSKLNFLHFPKIDVVADDLLARSVALSSAGDLTTKIVHEEAAQPVPLPDPQPVSPPTPTHDFGFTQESGALRHSMPQSPPQPTTPPQPETPQEPSSQQDSMPQRIRNQLSATVTRVTDTLQTFTPQALLAHGKGLAVVGVGVALIALIGLAFWYVPKTTITVLVDPQRVEKEETIVVNPNISESNPSEKVLAAKQLEVAVTGEKEIETSGKKTVGEKAQGDVVLLNKTLHTKTFQKDTVLIGPHDLEFTLDSDVTIASASEGTDSLSYGKETVSITAAEIGPEGNIAAGSDFTLKDFPASSYSARNDQALSGGVSREISVVSRDDIEALTDVALKELKEQAATKLQEKVGGDEALLSESLLAMQTDKSFSKEPGAEAKNVKGVFTVSYEAVAYSREQLFSLVEGLVSESVPDGYEVKKNAVESNISSIEIKDDGSMQLHAQFAIQLFPKIDDRAIAKEIAGKNIQDAQEYFKGKPSVAGVEITKQRTFPFLSSRLPYNPKNIVIEEKVQ